MSKSKETFYQHVYYKKLFLNFLDNNYDYSYNYAYYKKQIIDDVFIANNNEIKTFFINASKRLNFACCRCEQKFVFNNKFYYYVKRCKVVFIKFLSKIFQNSQTIKIIYFFVLIDVISRFNFKL